MKKLTFTLLAFLLLSSPSWGAVGTCTQSLETVRMDISGPPWQKVLTFTCTGGTAGDAGTITATAISSAYVTGLKGWYLYKIITNPGTPAPTDNWDFTLVDGDGIDVLGGAGANRHTTTSQMIAPLLTTGVYYAQPLLDTWTLTPTGSTEASAVAVIKLIFVR